MKHVISYIIEALIFICIIVFLYNHFDNKLDISNQNLKAAQNTIELVKTENGELIAKRDSYIATIDDLEYLLAISKSEIKDIQRELDSKIAYISKIESDVKIEYIETIRDSIIYINNTPSKSFFSYNDKWIAISGENEFKFEPKFDCSTTLNSIHVNVPLKVGLTEDYQLFVSTPNPYIDLVNMNGAVINNSILKKNKQKFNYGFQIGFGTTYNVITQDVGLGFYSGIGVEYNF